MNTESIPTISLLCQANLGVKRQVLTTLASLVAQSRGWHLEYLDHVVDSKDWTFPAAANGVIAWADQAKQREALARLPLPVVELGNLVSGAHPCIQYDNEAIGVCVARYFLDRGFRSFAFFGERMNQGYSIGRANGFQNTLAARGHGLAVFDTQDPKLAAADSPALMASVGKWVRDLPKPVGVLCDRDAAAAHLQAICRKENIPVPDDVAICGVGNDPFLCQLGAKPISSVALPSEQMARTAIDRMTALLAGETVPLRTLLSDIRVVERASTDQVAVGDPAVARVLAHIRDHYQDPIQTGDLAKVAGVSRRVLERRFQELTGKTLHAHLRAVRANRARYLLVDSDLPVAEIAFLCGFTEPQRLSEATRRQFGKSPTELRKGA